MMEFLQNNFKLIITNIFSLFIGFKVYNLKKENENEIKKSTKNLIKDFKKPIRFVMLVRTDLKMKKGKIASQWYNLNFY